MGVIIAFIVGGIVGIILMCLVQTKRLNNAVYIVKHFLRVMKHEKFIAAKEKQNFDYIKGMDRIIELYEDYWKEELQ